ncbi:MAG: hypothetical protein M1832_002838 [Thelocarpon impressellum]|nr:MAG: hypothetical protein M1832_002838 [Thelocarpon impressellum]
MAEGCAFFYGTLMAPQVLHRVIYGSPKPEPWQAELLEIWPAILHDHRRHKVRGCDYPGIIPCQAHERSSVRGTYVTGLTEGDIARLDLFEGAEYERVAVKVRLLTRVGDEAGTGNVESEAEADAETYVWIAGEHELEEGEWDFGEFRREKMGRWIGVDQGFADVDNAAENVEWLRAADPTRGRGLDGDITSQLNDGSEAKEEVLRSAV